MVMNAQWEVCTNLIKSCWWVVILNLHNIYIYIYNVNFLISLPIFPLYFLSGCNHHARVLLLRLNVWIMPRDRMCMSSENWSVNLLKVHRHTTVTILVVHGCSWLSLVFCLTDKERKCALMTTTTTTTTTFKRHCQITCPTTITKWSSK